jgi:membrane protease YdiL (CAAX protease family)
MKEDGLFAKPGPLVDLGLTLPIFLVYHLGVVFLRVRNATDLFTQPLLKLAEGSITLYLLITLGIGAAFAGVFFVLGRKQKFNPKRLVQIVIEGALYAIVLRFTGSYVVGHLFAASRPDAMGPNPFEGVIMSFGAGFYEELAFRVILFGLGAKALVWLFARQKLGVVATSPVRLTMRAIAVMAIWSLACAAIFSGVHYVGSMADTFRVTTFTFRLVLGLVLTLIYATRGFAAAVWAHALYDVWVLVL